MYGFQSGCSLAPRNCDMHAHHLHCVGNSILRYAHALLFPYTLLHYICRGCAFRFACSRQFRKLRVYGQFPPCSLTPRNYDMHAHHLHCVGNSILRYAHALLFPYTLLHCICRGCAPRSACSRQFHKDRAGVLLSVYIPESHRKTRLYLSEPHS